MDWAALQRGRERGLVALRFLEFRCCSRRGMLAMWS